jgi:periplasmic copper chaperone A
MHRPWFVDLGLVLLLVAVLCDGGLASAEPKVTVHEAWGPSMPPVAPMGAFYMIIRNAGNAGERLRGAHAPACNIIELHESYQKPGGAMGMDAMGMRPVPGGVIDIPAQSQVELKASGFHLMCFGKRLAFEKGAQFPLTLHFETSGEVTVPVLIREP